MNEEESLSKETVSQRIENAKLINMEESPSNCAGFVVSVVTGNREERYEPGRPQIEEFLQRREIVGTSREYDPEKAKDATFITVGYNLGERVHNIHYAIIDPINPTNIYQRFSFKANVSHGEASELLSPFFAETFWTPNGEVPPQITYYK